jgi:hypothetical protein
VKANRNVVNRSNKSNRELLEESGSEVSKPYLHDLSYGGDAQPFHSQSICYDCGCVSRDRHDSPRECRKRRGASDVRFEDLAEVERHPGQEDEVALHV